VRQVGYLPELLSISYPVLLNPKVHYRIHNSTPLLRVLSHNNLGYDLQSLFYKLCSIHSSHDKLGPSGGL